MESQGQGLIFIPRSSKQWLPFMAPLVLCGISWAAGGIPGLTDIGFATLTFLCVIFLATEFIRFPRRFGIGGILIYGGVLVWFCHDYFSNWFGADFRLPLSATKDIIAKVAFYHCLFIIMMILGLQLKAGRWLPNLILKVPEPGSETFYLLLVLAMQVIGISGFLFTSESLPVTLWNAAFGVWTDRGVMWLGGRTGNVNYSWWAYIAQILQVGQAGAIFATLFAIVISTKIWSKILCWVFWAFWTLYGFSNGRRGEMAMMVLPPIGLLFIKYQARIAMSMRRQSVWPYIIAGVASFGLLVIVQIEGTFRSRGLQTTDLSQLDITKNQGNTMFSEGLLAWSLIPEHHGYFRNTFIGEGFIRPIPEQIYLFVVGAIPRALWNNKPIDESWEWYNSIYNNVQNGTVGSTMSHGLVGSWFFNYGLGGIIEGGLVVGWLMGVSERVLQDSNGRPIGMFFSLAMAVWLFRIYRDFIFIELYGMVIGGVVLAILIRLLRPFMGESAPHETSISQIDPHYGASYGT